MGIPENLKRLRKREGMSQDDLAEASGVSQQLISQLERGVNSTTKTLPALAKALRANVQEIDPNYAPEPVIGAPAREELIGIWDRLGGAPEWQEFLLEQARQTESRVLRKATPRAPKKANG